MLLPALPYDGLLRLTAAQFNLDAFASDLAAAVSPTLGGGVALAAISVVVAVVIVPRAPFCIAAGFVFGWLTIPIIVPALTIGATGAFLLSRYFVSARVRRAIFARPGVAKMMIAIDKADWKFAVVLLFCIPCPATLKSYLLGLTRLSLVEFSILSFVAISVNTTLYVCIGKFARLATMEEIQGYYHIAGAILIILLFLGFLRTKFYK